MPLPPTLLEKKESEVVITGEVGVTTGGLGSGVGESTEQAGSWVKKPMLSIALDDALP